MRDPLDRSAIYSQCTAMTSLRAMVVGSEAPGAIENFYVASLRRLGCEVETFDPQKSLRTYSRANRIGYMLFGTRIFRRVNEQLLHRCAETRPEVVWIFKGAEFVPRTIDKLKALGCFVVNFNPDHPFIRTSVVHGGENVAACVPHYSLYFSYCRSLVQQLNQPAYWLPFGFDLSESIFDAIRDTAEIPRACFVGTVDRERFHVLQTIARQGFPLDIIGPNNRYAKLLLKRNNVCLKQTLFGQEFWSALRAYRVQLNFFRPHNVGSHNQRTFEVPAAGGILLTPHSDEQAQFFEENNEIYFYRDTSQMLHKLRTLLSANSDSVSRTRKAARERCMQENYTYQSRTEEALAQIQNYLQKQE